MRLIDTHAHLMDAAFDADRGALLERARAADVSALVVVGYDVPSSRAAVELATDLPNACATIGIHPNSAASADLHEIEALCNAPVVAAIGETGLDYYRNWTPHARQRESLAQHLALAERRALPVIVHNRDSDADVAEALERSAARRGAGSSVVPGVLHCFSSTSPEYLTRMLDAGYYVSFAGPLTFKSASALREMARRVPLERLLVETDCPYLAPVPHRGKRNEPAFVRETAACLASVRGLSLESLADQLWENSVRVFPILARVPAVSMS